MRWPLATLVFSIAGSSILAAAGAYGQGHADLISGSSVGLLRNDQRACQGYTLIAPMTAKDTYLIDMEGRVVRTWRSDWRPGLSAYLLESGNLLRSGAMPPGEQPFGGPGAGRRIQEFSWDGDLVWDFQFAVDGPLPHHDIAPLPNGNVLVVAWDRKTPDEAIAAGRRKELIGERPVLSDCILEIKPTGKHAGEIVWKWHVWDHLIQDHDQTKENYGDVSEHPELIDVNLTERMFGLFMVRQDENEGRPSSGGVDGPRPVPTAAPPAVPDLTADWTHINSVAYNPELDQIVVSVRAFSEIWVIDHGTTTAEAAGHTGGRRGKGGDLLYRWGNPRAYRSGGYAEQRLFKQHDAQWISAGLPGAGHLLVFNNGNNRPDGAYSTADEIVPPITAEGNYRATITGAFGPAEAAWSYAAPNKPDLFSIVISGAQRLANGNTLICSGISGTLLEVTPEKEEVWKYVNPVKGSFRSRHSAHADQRRVGRGGLPVVNNSVFRTRRYAPDFPGFHGRDLKPGKLLTERALELQGEAAN
jgi:hypothetical protein